jgi:UV excision repair protein RAD23
VEALMGLGFNRADCEAALRASGGDADRAFDILSGDRSSEEETEEEDVLAMEQIDLFIEVLAEHPEALEDVVRYLERESFPDVRQRIDEHLQAWGFNPGDFDIEGVRNRTAQPSGLLEGVLDQEEAGPIDVEVDRAIRPEGARPFGAAFDGRPFDAAAEERPFAGRDNRPDMLARFTPEQREAIQRLVELGNFPLFQVVQAFDVCDRNENLAANLLFTWSMEG